MGKTVQNLRGFSYSLDQCSWEQGGETDFAFADVKSISDEQKLHHFSKKLPRNQVVKHGLYSSASDSLGSGWKDQPGWTCSVLSMKPTQQVEDRCNVLMEINS